MDLLDSDNHDGEVFSMVLFDGDAFMDGDQGPTHMLIDDSSAGGKDSFSSEMGSDEREIMQMGDSWGDVASLVIMCSDEGSAGQGDRGYKAQMNDVELSSEYSCAFRNW